MKNGAWLGSSGLKLIGDRRKYPYQDAAIIALDCISRGKLPLVVHHGRDRVARAILPHLQKHLPAARIMNMRWVPLSDNYVFRRNHAIDISFADPSLIPGGYYISRIHVPEDKEISAEKMELLLSGIKEYLLVVAGT